MTSRELVKKTLEFENTGGVVPRDLWTLPWAYNNYGSWVEKILEEFPPDIVVTPDSHKIYAKKPISAGSPYEPGEFIDEWGVVFKNAQRGVYGEVKQPIVPTDDEEWADVSRVHFPEELLTVDTAKINEFCAATDKFVLSGDLVRPFERIQFIRGTETLYCDLATENSGMLKMLKQVHEFYCRLTELWCSKTDVDGFFAMDDWGSMRSLLINPEAWVKWFKPMYRDYVTIAHTYGKKFFFHSDGYTLDIIPHLIELGFDAVNLQIFCIGVEKLVPFKGKITFWGEMDRQHLLPKGSLDDIDGAVKKVFATVWTNGGAIAQCEFGAGANPLNVEQLYKSWSRVNFS
jgi:hypothetical protein